MKLRSLTSGLLALSIAFSGTAGLPLNAAADGDENETDIVVAEVEERKLIDGYAISGDWVYFKISDSEAAIVKYTGGGDTIDIPSEIDGRTVVAITGYSEIYESEYRLGVWEGAFEGCKGTFFNIPDTVTVIGPSAFAFCENLSVMSLPESVTSIGSEAFTNCTFLEKINIPKKVTKIEPNTFSYCVNLRKFDIPEGITEIGSRAFFECRHLSELTIPASVSKIGIMAFYNCKDLAEATVPKTVTSIGNYAFGFQESAENDFEHELTDDFVLRCYSGTEAEKYALNNGVAYELLDTRQMSKCTAAISAASYPYTGAALKPAVTVKYGSTTLKNGTDYTVAYKSNTNIGTATITITGKGGYTGTLTKTFSIIPANVTGLRAATTGQTAIKLGWTAVKGATGYVVYRYNPTTKSWVRLGVTKANSYMATGLTGGTTYAFTARAYTTVNGKNVYDSANIPKLFTTTNPAAPYFAVASTAKGRAYVKWNKVAGASGYVVYYRTAGGSWNVAGVVKNTANSFTKTGLRSGTAYAFAVRAYRTYGSKNYYGYFNQRGVLIK